MAKHEIEVRASLIARRTVEVGLLGRDGVTYMLLEVTPTELALLRRLETASKAASEYGCMPTLRVELDPKMWNWRHGEDEADE